MEPSGNQTPDQNNPGSEPSHQDTTKQPKGIRHHKNTKNTISDRKDNVSHRKDNAFHIKKNSNDLNTIKSKEDKLTSTTSETGAMMKSKNHAELPQTGEKNATSLALAGVSLAFVSLVSLLGLRGLRKRN